MVVFNIAEMVLFKVLCSFRNASMRTLHAQYTIFVHLCHCHCCSQSLQIRLFKVFSIALINILLVGQSVVVSHLPRVGSMSPHFILLLAMFLIFFLAFLWTELRIKQLLWCLLSFILCKRCLYCTIKSPLCFLCFLILFSFRAFSLLDEIKQSGVFRSK